MEENRHLATLPRVKSVDKIGLMSFLRIRPEENRHLAVLLRGKIFWLVLRKLLPKALNKQIML